MFLEIINIVLQSLNSSGKSDVSNFNDIVEKRRRRILLRRAFIYKKLVTRRRIHKICNYIEIVEKYDNETFISHFRLNRESFEMLLKKMEPIMNKPAAYLCRRRISPKLALLMTLWTLANQDSFRQIADRFGVAKGSAYYIVLKVCKILCQFSKEFIKWPSTREEIENIVHNFNNLRGSISFPNTVGCVDCMHIAVPRPKNQAISYFNRKSYYSVILQGICDSKFKFIDVFFGWPGRSHDANVWANSSIRQKLEDGVLPEQYHILGDSAYPLSRHLMVPYKDNGHLSREEINFNKKLSSSRVVIEQSFGLLVARFRRLKFLNVNKLEHAKYFCTASIVLHNLLIMHKDYDITFDNSENTDHLIDNMENSEGNVLHSSQDGRAKRNYLTEIL